MSLCYRFMEFICMLQLTEVYVSVCYWFMEFYLTVLQVYRVLHDYDRFTEFYVFVTGLQSFTCVLQVYRVLRV